MANGFFNKKQLPRHITYRTKLSFKKRLLGATGFVMSGVVAMFIQGTFIHNNPSMQNTWLTSGLITPTPNPLIIESDRLKDENRRLRELVSRGEVDRKMAEMDKMKIIRAIDKFLVGGLLENKGNVYYDSGKINNVSPVLMAAISIHETSDDDKNGNWRPGNSKVLRECNNVGGINTDDDKNTPHKGRYRVFKNIDESIYHLGYLLKNFYINQGRNDIASIGYKYCPPTGDPDDGKWGMVNSQWVPMVTKIYENISKEVK